MKPFVIKQSNASVLTNYTVMHMMADGACAAMLFGTVGNHASADRLALLLILYNTIALAGQALAALFADRVTNRHSGVQMAVMILVIGFLWPIKFSILPKVVLMGVGNCLFHSFASSSVLSRSGYRAFDIGIFAASGVLGLAVARYAQFYGYIMLAVLMWAACVSDKSLGYEETVEIKSRKPAATRLAPVFAAFLLLCVIAGSYFNYSADFAWDRGKKTILLIAAAVAAGRVIGGFLYDKLGGIFSVAAGVGGGAALVIFCGDSKMLSLAGILLLNMAVPAVLLLLYKFMPNSPGFSYGMASGFMYLGYIAVKAYPDIVKNKNAAAAVAAGTVLAVTVAAEIFLLIKARAAKTKSRVNATLSDTVL